MSRADRETPSTHRFLQSPYWNGILTAILLVVLIYSSYKIVVYQVDDMRNQELMAYTKSMLSYETKSTPGPVPVQSNSPQQIPYRPDGWPADVPWNPLHGGGTPISPEVTPTPTSNMVPADMLQPRLQFDKLLAINAHTVAWLKIEGTNIDYPVVQAKDNAFYLTRNFLQKRNVNGSIFMDYRNQLDDNDRNIVLYGHNMKNRSMFADLIYYESWTFYDDHPFIEFDSKGIQGKWQVFSAYYTDANSEYIETSFRDDAHFEKFLTKIQKSSIHGSSVKVNKNDIILTLSTCSIDDEDGRFTVHAKWMKPKKST